MEVYFLHVKKLYFLVILLVQKVLRWEKMVKKFY